MVKIVHILLVLVIVLACLGEIQAKNHKKKSKDDSSMEASKNSEQPSKIGSNDKQKKHARSFDDSDEQLQKSHKKSTTSDEDDSDKEAPKSIEKKEKKHHKKSKEESDESKNSDKKRKKDSHEKSSEKANKKSKEESDERNDDKSSKKSKESSNKSAEDKSQEMSKERSKDSHEKSNESNEKSKKTKATRSPRKVVKSLKTPMKVQKKTRVTRSPMKSRTSLASPEKIRQEFNHLLPCHIKFYGLEYDKNFDGPINYGTTTAPSSNATGDDASSHGGHDSTPVVDRTTQKLVASTDNPVDSKASTEPSMGVTRVSSIPIKNETVAATSANDGSAKTTTIVNDPITKINDATTPNVHEVTGVPKTSPKTSNEDSQASPTVSNDDETVATQEPTRASQRVDSTTPKPVDVDRTTQAHTNDSATTKKVANSTDSMLDGSPHTTPDSVSSSKSFVNSSTTKVVSDSTDSHVTRHPNVTDNHAYQTTKIASQTGVTTEILDVTEITPTLETNNPTTSDDIVRNPINNRTSTTKSVVPTTSGFCSKPCTSTKTRKACINGEPHYTTFDGMKFDYHGTCPYIVAEPCTEIDCFSNFSVKAKNRRVSSDSQYGESESAVLFERKIDPEHIRTKKISITFQNGYIRIRNAEGIEVTYHFMELCVEVPDCENFYGDNKLCGMTGSIDGKCENDLKMKNGTQVNFESCSNHNQPVSQAVNDFGNSWTTSDFTSISGKNETCEPGTTNNETSPCDLSKAQTLCQPILESPNFSGVFNICNDLDQNFIKQAYEACVFDTCRVPGLACTELELFASQCEEKLKGNWKTVVGCETNECHCIGSETCENLNGVYQCVPEDFTTPKPDLNEASTSLANVTKQPESPSTVKDAKATTEKPNIDTENTQASQEPSNKSTGGRSLTTILGSTKKPSTGLVNATKSTGETKPPIYECIQQCYVKYGFA